MQPRQSICASPGCLNIPSANTAYCFRCLRRWGKRQPVAESDDAKLYAVAGADLVKIGITVGLIKQRLACLQTGSPVKLKLLGFVECPARLEKSIHGLLFQHHSHGEWFRYEGLAKQVVQWIVERDRQSLVRWAHEGIVSRLAV